LPTGYDGEKVFVRGQSVNNSGGEPSRHVRHKNNQVKIKIS
jgi:hypothetical protein